MAAAQNGGRAVAAATVATTNVATVAAAVDDASWGFSDEDTVLLQVHWQNFDESERTWQPMGELYADVPAMVQKFVDEQDNDALTAALTAIKPRTSNATAATAASATSGV